MSYAGRQAGMQSISRSISVGSESVPRGADGGATGHGSAGPSSGVLRHHRHLSSAASIRGSGEYSALAGGLGGAASAGGTSIYNSTSSMYNSTSGADPAVVQETGTRTVYVIVQENLFHGMTGRIASVFDLKGVVRYDKESAMASGSSTHDSASSSSSSVASGAVPSGSSVADLSPADGSAAAATAEHDHQHPQDEMGGPADGGRSAQIGPANPAVLLDGDFLRCTSGLPVPLFERDKALMNVAIFNDTMFLKMLNVVDYSLLVGVQERTAVQVRDDAAAPGGGTAGAEAGAARTVVVNTMTAGIIDYLHPYNLTKRLENLFKDAQHEMKLRAAESTVQKASEYKRRFRAAADLYFMALPSSDTSGSGGAR